MYDVSNSFAPEAISKRFLKCSSVHLYNTRASSKANNLIEFSRVNSTAKVFCLVWQEGMELPPYLVCNLPKLAFKKAIRKALFLILEGKEDYIEAPSLLSKINAYFT